MSELWVEPEWAIKRETLEEPELPKKEDRNLQRLLCKAFPYSRKTANRVPVSTFDEKGKYVATYDSMAECARMLGSRKEVVRRVVEGLLKSLHGMQIRKADIMEYKGGVFVNTKSIAPLDSRPRRQRIAVSVYDLNGIYIATYPSVREAAAECGVGAYDVLLMIRTGGRARRGMRQLGGFQYRKARRTISGEDWDKSPIGKYRGRSYYNYWHKAIKDNVNQM